MRGDAMHIVAVVAANRSVGGTTVAAWLAASATVDAEAPVVTLDAADDQTLLTWARGQQPVGLIAAAWDESCTASSVRALADEGVGLVLIDARLRPDDPRCTEILAASDLVVIVVQPDGAGLDRVGEVLDLIEETTVPFLFAVNQATDDEEMTAATIVSLAQHGTVSPVIVPRHPVCVLPGAENAATNGAGVAMADDMAQMWDYLCGRLRPAGRNGAEPPATQGAAIEAAHYDRPATFVVPAMVYPCHVIDITADGLVFTSDQEIEPGVRLRMNLPYVGQIDCEIAEAEQGRMNAHFIVDDARRAELMGQVAMLVDYGREQGTAQVL